jgi:hypothetical protein
LGIVTFPIEFHLNFAVKIILTCSKVIAGFILGQNFREFFNHSELLANFYEVAKCE